MDWMDAEELAIVVCGLNENDDPDDSAIEDALYEKFDCSIEQFHKIAEALMPFTIPAKSALTDTVYCGFVKDGMFIAKQPVTPNVPHERAA